jgi:hypothetical protein
VLSCSAIEKPSHITFVAHVRRLRTDVDDLKRNVFNLVTELGGLVEGNRSGHRWRFCHKLFYRPSKMADVKFVPLSRLIASEHALDSVRAYRCPSPSYFRNAVSPATNPSPCNRYARVAQLSHNECHHRHKLRGSRVSWERSPPSVATRLPSGDAKLQPCRCRRSPSKPDYRPVRWRRRANRKFKTRFHTTL